MVYLTMEHYHEYPTMVREILWTNKRKNRSQPIADHIAYTQARLFLHITCVNSLQIANNVKQEIQ